MSGINDPQLYFRGLVISDKTKSDQWSEYEDKLYEIYLTTVVNGGLKFKGLPVKSRYQPPSNGKGFSFWHLISEGEEESERTPDLRRCEHIRWIAWIIKQAVSIRAISWWENSRGGNTHVVLWLEDEQYAVILAKRKDYYLIKTAYMVKPHREKSFKLKKK